MDDKIKNIFKRLLTVIILILMIQIIPIYAIKFPDWLFPQATKLGLNLGTIKQDNNLTADEDAIIVDENGKKYIVWTYTSKITKDKSAGVQREEPKDPKLERYFVTTKDSGLGEPEIISVTKDGQILETPYTFGSGNPDKFLSKKELVDLRENDKYGTYIYKIKTPILGYRDHYALDVNSVLTGVFGKNVTVNIGGIKRKLKKEETISVSLPQRLSISRNAYAQLKQEDRNDKVNIATSFDKFKNTAGEYLNEDRIVWRSSYLNQYSYKEGVEFDLTPDDSQLPRGDLKVYYFKPGENGYEIVESMTKIFKGETKAVIDDVPQGFIAQAVLEASVKDDGESKYKNHSLKNSEGVQLESLFAKLTIEKKWGTGVTEDQKSDTNYTISGGMYDKLRVTIPKGQSFNIINNVAKFNINAYLPLEQWDRIYYHVEEEKQGHFRLIFKGENKYTLKYTFKNDVESTTNPGSGDMSGGECSAYGVESLQTVEINQYWYEYKDDYSKSKKSKWYGFGGDLSGVLRVPKTADAGQSITLKLPDEIKFEHAVNDIPIIGFSRSSSSGGSVEIGKIYYESGNTLRFVFNKFAKADADYTVNFTLGQSVGEGQGLKEINGTSVNDYEFGKRWPVGIEPNLSRFYPDNPQTMETVTKTLPYISKYHNFKDTEECAEKVLGVETTVHYEDEKIADFCKHLSKYVAEEGSDYIIWEAVYNARNDNLRGGEIDFYDFLGVTNELYDGNNQEALPKDIEMYVADHGTVSGSYVKGTERQIYPRGGYAQVKGEKHNGKIYKSNLNKVYQLSFRVRDLGSQTLVVRIKTKKLAPLPDGDPNNPNTKKYYYNSIQSQQSARDKDNVVTLRYAPKLGRASGIAQGIYNFSFQKTELVKGNDGQEKEVPLRNSSCEFMAIRTDGTQNVKAVADKNGKVVFENLKDGEFIVQEIKPPNGYETYHEEFRFKITIDHVAGETAEIQKKVEYKKGHGNWQIWDPNNLPTIPNNISPNLKIKKLDAITGKQIEGAHFQLIKNKVGDESEYDQTIDEEGISEFVFSYLTPGVYTLKETKAPEGYEKADDIYINVENINGKTYIYHRSWLGDLNPRELDKEDGCYIFRLPNRKRSEIRIKKFDIYGNIINDNEQKAKFDLYAEDTGKSENEVAGFDFSVIKENSDPRYAKKEYVFEDGSKMNARLADKVFVTKAAEGLALDWAETPTKYLTNGEIEYKDLPDGNYFIMEAEAPSGYEKLKFPIPFIIENGRLKGSFSGYLPIVNIKKGEFYIEKVDKSDNKLEGVEFTLFEKNDKGEKAQQIEQKTTDANGLIKFDNLESGQYILEETKTINDYEIEGPFDISVDKYGRASVLDSDGQNLVVLRKLNESDNEKKPVIKIVNSKKYNLIIRKRDKLQVEKFMSASGDILSEEDKKALEEWEDNNNKEKKLIEDLKNFGVIDEKKAKETYEKWLIENPKPDISLNPQDFDADKKPTDTASEKFRVLKAKFELLDENQESFSPAKIGETNTGKKEGILRFDNLRTGIYYLKELEAPEGGYLGIRGAYKFEITDNGEIISLENKSAVVDKLLNNDKDVNLIIKNKKVKYGIRIKKIDYNNGATLGGNIIKTPARFRILDEHKKEVAGEVANLSDGDYRFINGGKYYKPGIYYIKEEKAPVLSDGSSFSMLSPNPFGIRLKGDGSIEVLDDSLEDMISFEGLEEAKTRNVSYRSVSVQDDEEDSSDEEENLEDEYFDSSSEIEKENLNEDLDDNSKENSDKNEDSKIENQDFLGIINKKLEESDKLIQNSEKLSELNNNQNIGSNEEGESKNKENKALPDLSETKAGDEIQKENKITMTPRALDNENQEAKKSLENSDKEAKIDKKDESLVKISEENEDTKNKGIFKNILSFYKTIKNNGNNKLEDLKRSVRSLAADTETDEDEALFDGISTIKISNANTKTLRLSKRVKQTNQAINEGNVTFKLKKDTSKKYIIKKFKVNEEIVFNNLLPGNYTLEELDAPLGYVKEKIKYKLVVDSNGAKLYEDNTKEDSSYQKGMKIIKSEDFNNTRRGHPESYALDNDENTYAIWQRFQGGTDRLPVGAYLGVDLGALKNISYILINQGHPENWNDRFKNFVLEYSSDGINYTIFKEYEESEGSGIAHLNMNIDARYIRLRNLREIQTWIGIQDFVIYAKPYNEIQNESGLYLIGNRQNPNINLLKVDKSGNEINGNGAKFELRKVDDSLNSNENLNADSGELAYKLEIGNNGSVFIDKNNTPLSDNKLPLSEYGKYILVEKQAPNGYRLLDKPILLELSEDINDESKTKLSIVDAYSKKFANIENAANNTIRLKIKNFKEGSGEFAISKRIKGIENIKNLIDKELSFRLSKDNDNSFVPIEKKAKANTNIIFDGLKDGVYTLEELNPPEGYVKEKKNYKVVVSNSGKVEVFDLDNISKNSDKKIQLSVSNLLESEQLKKANMSGARTRDKIFDSNNDTVAQYVLNGSVINEGTYIGVDLCGYYDISQIKFVQDPTGKGGNDKFDKLVLESSIDGINYKELKRYNDSPKIIELTKLSEKARFIRIRNLEKAGGRWFMLNTIDISGKSLAIKTIEDSINQDINVEENLVKIGNIQNPKLDLIKTDENGNIITNNNADGFTAKFKLYKIDDNKSTLSNEEKKALEKGVLPNGFKEIQEFTLKGGKLLNVIQKASELGRYLLFETNAPQDYIKAKPIFMDLIETRQNHSASQKKATSCWKLLEDTTKYPIEDAYPKFSGEKEFKDLKIDYKSLAQNKLILKIKNKKMPKGAFSLYKKVETNATPVIFKESDNLKIAFKLTKDDDKGFLMESGVKGAHEKIEFNNLSHGVYSLEEALAPEGYIKKLKPYKVYVDECGNTAIVENIEGLEQNNKIPLTANNLILSERFKNRPLQYGSYNNIFDGNENSGVQINMDGNKINADDYIGVDLKGLYKISNIRFCQAPKPSETIAGNDAFDDMLIEYSIDGKTFYAYPQEFINENKPERPNTNANTEITDQNIVARFIRFRNTQDSTTRRWFIAREIVVKGAKIGDEYTVANEKRYTNLLKYVEFGKKDKDIADIPNMQNPHLDLQKVDKNGNLISSNNRDKAYNAKFKIYKIDDNKTELTATEVEKLLKTEAIQEFVLKNGKLAENSYVKNQFEQRNIGGKNLNVINQKMSILGRYALIEEEAPDGYEVSKPILLDLVKTKIKISMALPDYYIISSTWKLLEDKTKPDSKGFYKLNNQNNENISIDYSAMDIIDPIKRKGTISIKVKNDKQKARLAISKRIKGIEDVKNFANDKKVKFKLINDASNTYIYSQEKEAPLSENIIFDNLLEGLYTLKEVKAPEGYVKDDDYKIYIDKNLNINLYRDIDGENEKSLGTSEITIDKTITGSFENQNAIIDGNEDTQGIIKPNNSTVLSGQYLELRLNDVYKLSSLKLIQDKNGRGGNDAFDKFSIEYSIDGINFEEYKIYENANKPNKPNTILNINEEKLDIFAKAIRFKSLETSGSRWLRINEISLRGRRVKDLQSLNYKNQKLDKINLEENLLKIGNIQNPKISLEKIDKKTEALISNNIKAKDYNAKFTLYKLLKQNIKLDKQSDFTNTDNFEEVQKFTLKSGKLEENEGQIQKADSLGRYVLVETETPDGYVECDPIELELVETIQSYNSNKKHITSWKLKDDKFDKEEGFEKFIGQKNNEAVIFDYSELANDKIKLRIKNEKGAKKLKIKIVKVDNDNKPIKGNESTSARFFISKDGINVFNGQIANLKSGYFEFDNKGQDFEPGLYYLVEERAPKSHVKLSKPIPFYIEKNGNLIIPAKSVTGSDDKYEQDTKFVYKNLIKVEQAGQTNMVIITITNTKSIFSNTGGMGSTIFYVLGLFIMTLSGYFLKKRYKGGIV